MIDLRLYATLIFDCDGVILNSNKLKTAAFVAAARPYGVNAAEALAEHHMAHGGVSRYRKFEHFLRDIVGVPVEQSMLDSLLETYGRLVRKGLLTCNVDPGLGALREATSSARWMVVSAGDQDELRDIFHLRNLTKNFDGGIFGSPDTKEAILAREQANSNIQPPALFIGDSRYDHEISLQAGIDFVFASQWTEFSDWKSYQRVKAFPAVHDLRGLLEAAR